MTIGFRVRQARYRLWRWQWRQRWRLAQFIVEMICGADLLWDDDDPAEQLGSIQEWGDNVLSYGETSTVTVQRALSLKKKTYRVTAPPKGDEDRKYLITEIKQGAA